MSADNPLRETLFGVLMQRALRPCPHGRLRGIRTCEFCDYDDLCTGCREPARTVDRVPVLPLGFDCLKDEDGSWYCARRERLELAHSYRYRFCGGHILPPYNRHHRVITGL